MKIESFVWLGQTLRCALCMAAALLGCAGAAAQAPLEPAVKAAYIYRFLEYVTWPGDASRAPDQPIVIGVTREDEVADELRRIARERTVHDRRIVVVMARPELENPLHVLYVAAPDVARFLKDTVRQRPVLIVTDAHEGLERGATINFVRSEGRLKFEVSYDAIQRSGLSVSSRLLAVAIRVKKGEYEQHIYALLEGLPARTRKPRSAAAPLSDQASLPHLARLIAPRL